MPTEVTEVSYTTSASAQGGRQGHVRSADGVVDFTLAAPGTFPEATANPETLFASGYAACFSGALNAVGRMEKLDLSESTVTVTVSFGKTGDTGFGLAVDITAERSRHREGQGRRAGREGAQLLPLFARHPRATSSPPLVWPDPAACRPAHYCAVAISVFDLFSIGIGPSSSHTGGRAVSVITC